MYLLTLGRFTDNLIHIDTHACTYILYVIKTVLYMRKRKKIDCRCVRTRECRRPFVGREF